MSETPEVSEISSAAVAHSASAAMRCWSRVPTAPPSNGRPSSAAAARSAARASA
ncbi:hypothetical protein [Quadrisphaera sp. INWT6]|uniref:hypothetical protein n=1 Tax=Quadrisphaera sp. INWT6 TaxID=2596917 RepID=UPI001892462B|nr:hypothetical protein [Quadrisphaera sp. INWT6]